MFSEAKTMKLQYRGQTYETDPTNTTPDTHEVTTIYRGVKTVVRHGDRLEANRRGQMKYRGVTY